MHNEAEMLQKDAKKVQKDALISIQNLFSDNPIC